jgi:hypothetical protein
MPVSFTHCHAFGGVGLCVEQVGLPVRVWRENHACNLASENTGLAFFSTSLLSAPSFGWGRAARPVLAWGKRCFVDQPHPYGSHCEDCV